MLGASPSSTKPEAAVAADAAAGQIFEALNGPVALRSDSGDELMIAANGASTFSNPVPGGPPYRLRAVTVPTQATGQICAVRAVAGMAIPPADNVQVVCSPRTDARPQAPPPPAGLSVSYDVKSLRFSWNPSPGATYYQLLDNTLMWTMPDFFVTRVNNITATSYQLAGLFGSVERRRIRVPAASQQHLESRGLHQGTLSELREWLRPGGGPVG